FQPAGSFPSHAPGAYQSLPATSETPTRFFSRPNPILPAGSTARGHQPRSLDARTRTSTQVADPASPHSSPPTSNRRPVRLPEPAILRPQSHHVVVLDAYRW